MVKIFEWSCACTSTCLSDNVWLFANFLWCSLRPLWHYSISYVRNFSPIEWAWHLVLFTPLPTLEVNPQSVVVLSTWYRPNAVPPLNNWTFYPAVSLSVNMSWQHNIQFVIYSVLYFPLTALQLSLHLSKLKDPL